MLKALRFDVANENCHLWAIRHRFESLLLLPGALGNAAAATLAAATAAATAVATLATATSTHHCQQSSGSALKL